MRPRLSLTPARFVTLALIAAFALRVVVVMALFVDDISWLTSDAAFYLEVARLPYRLFMIPEVNEGWPVTSVGPVYPLYLASFVHVLPTPQAQVMGTRLGQALLDTLAVYWVYRLARTLFDDQRVALVALAAQALDPRGVMQVGLIATESLFIPLFIAFMLVYVQAVQHGNWRRYVGAGALLGVATLTRPVPILFPVVLVIHAWLNRDDRRRALGGAARLALAMALVVTPWIVRVGLVTGEFVPVADTASSHFWLASHDDARETGPGTFEEMLEEEVGYGGQNPDVESGEYLRAGLRRILQTPGAWLGRVAGDTIRAYLQPYGTILLIEAGTPSVRESLRELFSGEIPLKEFLETPGLWRRLMMYAWHYWGLLLGLAGIALGVIERRWRRDFPLTAWIAYGTAVTAVLLIEPRYVFPLMFAFTILAAYGSVRLWDLLSRRAGQAASPAPDLARPEGA